MNIGFYIKGEAIEEMISVKEFPNMTTAIETFAQTKNLTVTNFLELFSLRVVKT